MNWRKADMEKAVLEVIGAASPNEPQSKKTMYPILPFGGR
jgi:hypothetical protein